MVALAGALVVVLLRPLPGTGTPVDVAQTTDEAEDVNPFWEASKYCDRLENYGGVVADGGSTLTFDMQGDDFGSGDGTVEALQCLLFELKVPDYVITMMDSTRALDGRQSAEWDGYEASWIYHPDSGLDVVFRRV